jgi:hypothetical protein
MRRFFAIPIVWLLAAVPSFAQGPLLTPPPANPCGDARLTTLFIANEVGTSAGGSACPVGGCAETMVVCTHRGKTAPGKDRPIDLMVQMFTAGGTAAGSAAICGLLPGASGAFVTGGFPLPAPYSGTVIGGPPVVPLGSLRVLTAGPRGRAVCDVTSIDVSSIATGVTSFGPAATKDVKITRASKYQRGD